MTQLSRRGLLRGIGAFAPIALLAPCAPAIARVASLDLAPIRHRELAFPVVNKLQEALPPGTYDAIVTGVDYGAGNSFSVTWEVLFAGATGAEFEEYQAIAAASVPALPKELWQYVNDYSPISRLMTKAEVEQVYGIKIVEEVKAGPPKEFYRNYDERWPEVFGNYKQKVGKWR